MNKKSLASLVLLSSLTTTLPAWAKTIPDDLGDAVSNGKLTRDATLTDCGTLAVNALDLNGHTLTLTGVTGMSGTGTINGAVGSVLDVELTKNVEQTAKLTGSIKLIKRGSGIWTTKKDFTSYSGGTELFAGGFQGPTSGNSAPYGNPVDVLVHAGATFYTHGYYGFKTTDTITLDGGTLSAGRKDATSSHKVNAAIVLTKDSSFAPDNQMSIGSAVALGGYTLNVGSSFACWWTPSSIENGVINITKGTWTLLDDIGKTAAGGNPTADLILGANTGLAGAFTYSVRNLTFNTTAEMIDGTIAVYGTYEPASATAYFPVMMDGSTLDLSGLSDAALMTSDNFGAGTVTIALGERTFTNNQQIVIWNAKPAATTTIDFTCTGDGFDKSKISISEAGIAYGVTSKEVVSATWTGEGVAGDLSDPDNWDCRTATGERVVGAVPAAKLKVTFPGDVSDIAFNGQFPFASVCLANAELSKACDWTGFDLNRLTDDSVLDTKGNVLAVSAGAGESKTAATITNSDAESALTLNVADGQTYTNGTLNITGNLKLVKDGTGVLVAKKYPMEYTGITEVAAGVLRCAEKQNLNATASKSPFGAARTVDVLTGGVLDPAGSTEWAFHTVNMRGGSISNTVTQMGRGTSYNSNVNNPFNPVLNLYTNSLMASTETFNFQGTVNLKEDATCLELRIALDTQFLWNPSATSNLHLKVTQGGWLDIWQRAPVTAAKNPDFTLEMSGAALALYYYDSDKYHYHGGLGVCNYISSYGEKYNKENDAVLSVSGAFVPQGEHFYGCTMLDGSKMDLGGQELEWSIQSKSDNNNTVKFAADATVTIDVGTRKINADDVLVTWPADTDFDGRKFVLSGADVEGLALSCDANGIKVVSTDTKIHSARWTNADGDGNFGNTNNWFCANVRGVRLYNVLPDQDTAVVFPVSALSNLNCPTQAFPCASLTFTNENPGATLELAKNCDWRGLGEMDFSFPIDLKGHDLALALGNVAETNVQAVTNSEAEPAKLVVSVAAGKTYLNGGIGLSGNLTLVKIGDGTYVAATPDQSYAGGTVVSNGVLKCMKSADISASAPFGVLPEIDVLANGALDPAGSYNWTGHALNMRGGIIANTVSEIGCENKYTAKTLDKPFNPTLNLFAPTSVGSTGSFNFMGTIHANGNRLTISLTGSSTDVFTWVATTDGPAEVEFTSGKLMTIRHFPPVTPEMTLIMNGAAFDFGCAAFNVSNYVAKTTAYDAIRAKADWHDDAYRMNVSGTFTPVSSKFFGCTMLNGSTICLADKSGAWSNATGAESGKGRPSVDFADSAMVTIDVGDRKLAEGEPILTWTEVSKPSNLAGLKFVLNESATKKGYRIRKGEAGLSVEHASFVLLIR